MEDQIPLIIKIPCEEDEQRYDVNYPSVESLKSRGMPTPEVWKRVKGRSVIEGKDVEYGELKFYEGKKHIATLLLDLNTEEDDERVIEVRLMKGREWLIDGRNARYTSNYKGAMSIYYSGTEGTDVCLSEDGLQDELRAQRNALTIVRSRQPFFTGIEFVTWFIKATKNFRQLDKSGTRVQEILTDYVTLNPGVFDELGFPDPRSNKIDIPDIILKYHKEQFKKLTERGCISKPSDFRHDDLDAALKIAINPLLEKCYKKLKSSNSIVDKVEGLTEIFTELPKEKNTVIDLTGMNFRSAMSFSEEEIKFAPGNFNNGLPILFDYANFDGLNFGNETNWAGVSLRHASFVDCRLLEMNFAKADLTDANFREAKLAYADLAGADLTGANFRYANLTEADLTGANIADADFHKATLTGIKWPLLKYTLGEGVPLYEHGVSPLPKLNWNINGADFILQQLERIGEDSTSTIEIKQTRARQFIDKALSNIHTSEELVKFAALIDGKEGKKFAYLRQETELFRGSFFNFHGNTDTWRYIIGKLKIHLDILLVKETQPDVSLLDDESERDENEQGESTSMQCKKIWNSKEQLKAFKKIMGEHRGRWFGEVTHTKLYSNHKNSNEYYTILPSFEDEVKLRNSYIDQDAGFKKIIENVFEKKRKLF